jgi:hypothetical protein
VTRVESQKGELERWGQSLNRYSQSAIDRFNAAVGRHNALLEEARSERATFNLAVERHNDSVIAYNAACAGGKKYYADDLEAAKRNTGLE